MVEREVLETLRFNFVCNIFKHSHENSEYVNNLSNLATQNSGLDMGYIFLI